MKRIIIFMLILLSYGICEAQKAFKIGVKASIGSSWFGIKEEGGSGYYTDGSSTAAYSIGGAAEVKLSKVFYLQPEILFTRTSGSYTYINESANSEGETSYSYFFFDPVKMNQVQFIVSPKLKLGRVYLMAGPSYGILFGNNNAIHRKGSDYTSYKKFDKDDIALNTSFGVDIVKKPLISLEVRHYRGFVKMDNLGYHQSFISFGTSILF